MRARRARFPDGARKRWRTRRGPPLASPPFAPVEDLAGVQLRETGIWTVDTVNPNCWDAALELVLPRSTADALLVQETKLLSSLRLDAALRAAQLAG